MKNISFELIQNGEHSKQELLDLFWHLQGRNSNKHLQACNSLVNIVLQKQGEKNELCSELEYTFSRLIQGLASGRKHIKLGFATTLAHLLSKISSSLMNSQKFLYLINNQLSASNIVSMKSALKELHQGKIFCLLALIKSHKLKKDCDAESIAATTTSLVKFFNKKVYLKKMACHGIQDLVMQVDDDLFKEGIWSTLFPLLKSGWEQCTAETFKLLNTCLKHHPNICGKNFLRSCGWINENWIDASLLSEEVFEHLSSLLFETVACHPNIDELAFYLFSSVAEENPEKLIKFWCFLENKFFQSNYDRKYLGFHLATHSLTYIKSSQVEQIWTKQVVLNLHDALLRQGHFFCKLCKDNIPNAISTKLSEKSVTPEVQYALLFRLFSSPAGIFLDQVTHTNLISSVVYNFKLKSLNLYISWLKTLFLYGNDNSEIGIKDQNLNTIRNWASNQLTQLLRCTSLPKCEEWISSIITFLFFHAYFKVISTDEQSKVQEVNEINSDFINLSDVSHAHMLKCVTTAITHISNMETLHTISQHDDVSHNISHPGLMSTGQFWLTYLLHYAESLLSLPSVKLAVVSNHSTKDAWLAVIDNVKQVTKIKNSQDISAEEARVLELLLSFAGLQLLSPDSILQSSLVNVLDDLAVIVSTKSSQTVKVENNLNWVEVVVEIILSLLVSESSCFRMIGQQAFRLLSPHLTADGLQLILDVLVKDHNDTMEVTDDVFKLDTSDSEDDLESDDRHTNNSTSSNDCNAKVFNDKFHINVPFSNNQLCELKNSDECDEEEVDDEQMMKLDSIFSNYLKKRKKLQINSAIEQMLRFHLRCLDLIEIFLSRCHGNTFLIFNIPIALLQIVLKTSNDHRKIVLYERASTLLNDKIFQTKHFPRNIDPPTKVQCLDNIIKLLEMARKGLQDSIVAQLHSNCCLMQLKGICSCSTSSHNDDLIEKVCTLYSDVIDEYMMKRQSKVHFCLISDFVNKYPLLSLRFAEKFIKYMEVAIHPYRQLQASLLVLSLYRLPISLDQLNQTASLVIASSITIITKLIEKKQYGCQKYLRNILRIVHFAVNVELTKKEQKDYSNLIELLKKLLALFNRSQKLTTLMWKVLKDLGVNQPKSFKEKKRKKLFKGKKLALNRDEETNALLETGETRRKLKVRILKEKRERSGKKVKRVLEPAEAERKTGKRRKEK